MKTQISINYVKKSELSETLSWVYYGWNYTNTAEDIRWVGVRVLGLEIELEIRK